MARELHDGHMEKASSRLQVLLASQRASFRLSLLLVCALALATPLAAWAQSEDSAPDVEAQFFVDGEGDGGFLIVVGTLPEDVPLPATLRLPLPAGTQVWWSGEIVGGGPQNDIPRENKIVEVDGGQAVEFSLEETRVGQYEGPHLPTVVSGGRRTAKLDWIQTVPASSLQLSVRLPAGAQNVEIKPAPAGVPARNDSGESLYLLPEIAPETGSQTLLEVSYETGSLTAPDTGKGGPSTLTVLVIAVAFFVVALVFLLKRQRAAAVYEYDEVYDEADGDHAPEPEFDEIEVGLDEEE